MFELNLELGKSWEDTKTNRLHVPTHIDTECPNCGRSLANVHLKWHHTFFMLSAHTCVGCQQTAYFILANPPKSARPDEQNNSRLFMYPAPRTKQKIDDRIVKVSPSFESIYNQALIAEKLGLYDICGMGYRKALEFLLREYLKYKQPDKADSIDKTDQLGQVINNFVKNPEIKIAAERASWLGNDETHYRREWIDKDLGDLKTLLEAVLYWINMQLLVDELPTTMPNPKKERKGDTV